MVPYKILKWVCNTQDEDSDEKKGVKEGDKATYGAVDAEKGDAPVAEGKPAEEEKTEG